MIGYVETTRRPGVDRWHVFVATGGSAACSSLPDARRFPQATEALLRADGRS